jgi:cytochrome oxidase Cu insertion factor (SCO1/SenC/PrrC family)
MRLAVSFAVLVGGVLAAVGVLAVSRNGSDGNSGLRAGAFRGSEPPAGIRVPDFTLRSYRGQRVNGRDFRGRVLLVTFLETRCKEACPIIAREIAHGLGLLAPGVRRTVVALAISTHPHDDTPASVRAFLRRHRAEGKLDYLICTEAELRPVWKRFHVLSALDSGDADTHSASVRVYDRSGEWVSTLHPGVDLKPGNLAHDIRGALRESR